MRLKDNESKTGPWSNEFDTVRLSSNRVHVSCMLVDAMNLAHPMQSVIPSAHGAVLGVLARTSEPLTGRRIATLTRPRFSQSRVNRVLGELARDGIAEVDIRPPASYYRLNHEHVAAPGILALASMWQTLLDRIQASLSTVADAAGGDVAVRLRRTSRSGSRQRPGHPRRPSRPADRRRGMARATGRSRQSGPPLVRQSRASRSC